MRERWGSGAGPRLRPGRCSCWCPGCFSSRRLQPLPTFRPACPRCPPWPPERSTAGGPAEMSNLGVYHMRKGHLEQAAHAYATAIRRARFSDQKLDELRENIGAFRQQLRQPYVPDKVRRACVRALAQAEADLENSDLPTSPPLELLYAQQSAKADKRHPRDDAPATTIHHVEGRNGFFRFLKSKTFRKKYFERRPVLIRMGNGKGSANGSPKPQEGTISRVCLHLMSSSTSSTPTAWIKTSEGTLTCIWPKAVS